MSPRAYNSAKRQAAAEATKERILAAAREMLSTSPSPQVSVDSVAKAADVSRQTIYNLFGSKAALLEALFDSLAGAGGLALAPVFGSPDLGTAIPALVGVFCRFWESDRLVIRRLHGMAVLDPELEKLLRERDERRRRALQALLSRFQVSGDDVLDVLWALTSFEAYDAFGDSREGPDIARLLTSTAQAAIRELGESGAA